MTSVPVLDRQAIAALAGRSVSTVRGWERKGYIRRVGIDECGRATYAVAGAARQIGRRTGQDDRQGDTLIAAAQLCAEGPAE